MPPPMITSWMLIIVLAVVLIGVLELMDAR